ncbi:MAG: TetR/AcrR family transcriptional regulator [Phenylobacterium sp.]|jgi:AcrR family transcriptional regulator|uniref:TetR/AcrR family transcriptional regulator n=1 Tax=Phenylobacterium sp. TaxID=1871053 RepID=UPI002A36E8E8|nr:TetR/AcrR family transcriptional regulator [Phenylobacterium sp.]MDX9999416.1 TetR/AcrR family transcriptional regulator [Phenylobacterium sp.]
MQAPGPKFRRRKDARPAEIVAAAFEVFAEKGFARAKLDDIARRAGVSKGAVYLYFETKEDIFRAVVAQGVAPSFEAALTMLAQHPGPFPDLARALTERVAEIVGQTPVGGVVKMVIGEARNFPELARVWHDQLVGRAIEALAGAVAAAQARGEVRPGDPRAHALTLISPLLVGVIWRETFTPIGAEPFDLPALARLHVETVLSGMLERAA